MRVRLPLRRSAFFGSVFVVALIAALPLRVAFGALDLDRLGLSARAARGTIWSGQLKEARLGTAELGDVDTWLAPLPLLTGQARIAIVRAGLQGTVEIARHSLALRHVTGTIPAASIAGPLPLAGLELTDVSVGFRDNICDSAEGTVRVTIAGTVPGLALPQGLTGMVRCDGGALLVPLSGASGAAGLTTRVHADGRYETELRVQPPDASLVPQLIAAGFTPAPGGYTLKIGGRF